MGRYTFKGEAIAYEFQPKAGAELLILIHPLGMNRTVWGETFTYFGEKYAVLAIDLPGHGESPAATGALVWSIPLLAEMVQALAGELGFEKAHYVGTSIGGAIGQELALTAPQFLLSGMFTNTASQIGTEESWGARAKDVRSRGLKAMAREIVPRWFGPEYLKDSAAITAWENALAEMDNESYALLCEALGSWGATERFEAEIPSIPVVALAGELDPAMPLENMEALAQLIAPERELIVLPIGHVPSEEAPEQFNNALQEWLNFVAEQSAPEDLRDK